MDNNAEFINEFILESYENLDKVDAHLLKLEKDPSSPAAALADLFRAFHTIKGTGRFFNLQHIEALTHFGEDVLARLRDGRLALRPEAPRTLLALSDAVRSVLKSLERSGTEGSPDTEARLAAWRSALEGGAGAAPPETAASDGAAPVDTTVRVDVHELDRLMAQIGELVITRNHLMQRAAFSRDPAVAPAVQRLSYITAELQGRVMKMRLQPLGALWAKLPRMVRDLAVSLKKDVRMTLEGGETELDKSLLEAVRDPIVHLVRNAVDHGIESPEDRRRAGKPVSGHLRLSAFHEGGVVHIVLSDDGAGLSYPAIRRKALERRCVSEEQAERLGEADWARLIFLPGFSTAARVTSVSGRGVGLDVVKTNIEKIGGTVDVRSSPGGTEFRLKIPLTLAIIPTLVVASRGRRYALPQAGLLELIRLREDDGGRRVEVLHGAPVFRWRGRLIPVVYLDRVLHGAEEAGRHLLVLQSGHRLFGLAVERVIDTAEVVVKPLDRRLSALNLYEGATVLGDGSVVLIIDAPGLAEKAGVREEPDAPLPPPPAPPSVGEPHLLVAGPDDGRLAFPLSRVIRLEEVPLDRVERVGGESVLQHRLGVLRVRRLGELLVERRKTVRQTVRTAASRGRAHIVVCRGAAEPVGLAVERILDIVDDPLGDTRPGSRPGVRATAVLRGRVTEILDLDALFAPRGPGEGA